MSVTYLPREPFVRIIEEAAEREGTVSAVVARIRDKPVSEIKRDSLYRNLRRGPAGNYRRIRFDIADLIVTRVLGPQAWHDRPELAELYE